MWLCPSGELCLSRGSVPSADALVRAAPHCGGFVLHVRAKTLRKIHRFSNAGDKRGISAAGGWLLFLDRVTISIEDTSARKGRNHDEQTQEQEIAQCTITRR